MADAGRCWQMLADAGRCWQMLADAGRCWQMLADAGRCWQMCHFVPLQWHLASSVHAHLLRKSLQARNRRPVPAERVSQHTPGSGCDLARSQLLSQCRVETTCDFKICQMMQLDVIMLLSLSVMVVIPFHTCHKKSHKKGISDVASVKFKGPKDYRLWSLLLLSSTKHEQSHCILGAKRHFHFGASPKLFSVTNKILLVKPFRTVQFWPRTVVYPLPDPPVPPRDSSVRCLAHIGQCLTPQPLIAGLPDFDCVMCIYE